LNGVTFDEKCPRWTGGNHLGSQHYSRRARV
ncbi:unnamed protein product, partial [marine sediment metagenome]